MRTMSKAIEELNVISEFKEYLQDYTDEIESKIPVKLVQFDLTDQNSIAHHIFTFEIKEGFTVTDEIKALLEQDDDSQPHNTYIIWLDTLIVYSTRYS